MKKTLILLIFLIISAIAAPDLFAKCAMVKYGVKGTIKIRNSPKEQDLLPLEGARVYIYFDEAESTFAEGHNTKYPDFFNSTKNGEYEATAFFLLRETISFFLGEKCQSNDPSIVEVIILREGKKANRRIFHQKDFKVSGDKRDKLIQLPEIEIWK